MSMIDEGVDKRSNKIVVYDDSVVKQITSENLSEVDSHGNLIPSGVSVSPPDLYTLVNYGMMIQVSRKKLTNINIMLDQLLNTTYNNNIASNVLTAFNTHNYNYILNCAIDAGLNQNVDITTNTTISYIVPAEDIDVYKSMVGKVLQVRAKYGVISSFNMPVMQYNALFEEQKATLLNNAMRNGYASDLGSGQLTLYGGIRKSLILSDKDLNSVNYDEATTVGELASTKIGVLVAELVLKDESVRRAISTMEGISADAKQTIINNIKDQQDVLDVVDIYNLSTDIDLNQAAKENIANRQFDESKARDIRNFGNLGGATLNQEIFVKGHPYAITQNIDSSRKDDRAFQISNCLNILEEVTKELDPMTRPIIYLWNQQDINAQWLKSQKEAILQRPDDSEYIIPKGNFLQYYHFALYGDNSNRSSTFINSIDLYQELVDYNEERMKIVGLNDFESFYKNFKSIATFTLKEHNDELESFEKFSKKLKEFYTTKFVRTINMIATRPKLVYNSITTALEKYDIADAIRFINLSAFMPQFKIVSNPYKGSLGGNILNPYLLSVIAAELDIDNGLINVQDTVFEGIENRNVTPQLLLAKIMKGSCYNYMLYYEVIGCRDYMTNANSRYLGYKSVINYYGQEVWLKDAFQFITSNNANYFKGFAMMNDIAFAPFWYYTFNNGKTLFETCIEHYNNDHNQFLNQCGRLVGRTKDIDFNSSCSKFYDVPHSLKIIYLSLTALAYILINQEKTISTLITLVYGLNGTPLQVNEINAIPVTNKVINRDDIVLDWSTQILGSPNFHSFINYYFDTMSYVDTMRRINRVTPNYRLRTNTGKSYSIDNNNNITFDDDISLTASFPRSNCYIPANLLHSAFCEQQNFHYVHSSIVVLPCATDDATITVFYDNDTIGKSESQKSSQEVETVSKRIQMSTNNNIGYNKLLIYNYTCLPVKINYDDHLKIYDNCDNLFTNFKEVLKCKEKVIPASSYYVHTKRLAEFNDHIDIQYLQKSQDINNINTNLKEFLKNNFKQYGSVLRDDLIQDIQNDRFRLSEIEQSGNINDSMIIHQLESSIQRKTQMLGNIRNEQLELVESYKEEVRNGKRSIREDIATLEDKLKVLINRIKSIEYEDYGLTENLNDEDDDVSFINQKGAHHSQKGDNISKVMIEVKQVLKDVTRLVQEYVDSSDSIPEDTKYIQNVKANMFQSVKDVNNTIDKIRDENNQINHTTNLLSMKIKGTKKEHRFFGNKTAKQKIAEADALKQLKMLQQTNDIMSKQLAKLNSNKTSLENSLKETEEIIRIKARTLEEQEIALNEAALMTVQADSALFNRIAHNATFTEKLDAMKEIYKLLKNESVRYRQQLDDEMDRNKKLANDIQTIRQESTQFQSDNIQLNYRLKSIETEKETIAETLKALRQEHEKKLAEKDKAYLEAEKKITISERAKAELEKKIAEINESVRIKGLSFNQQIEELKLLKLKMSAIENGTDIEFMANKEYKEFIRIMKNLMTNLANQTQYTFGKKIYVNKKQQKFLQDTINEISKNSKLKLDFNNIIFKLNSSEEDIAEFEKLYKTERENVTSQLEKLTKEKNAVLDNYSSLILELTGELYSDKNQETYITLIKKMKLSKSNEESLIKEVASYKESALKATKDFELKMKELKDTFTDPDSFNKIKQQHEIALKMLQDELAVSKKLAQDRLNEIKEANLQIKSLKDQVTKLQSTINDQIQQLSIMNDLKRQVSELQSEAVFSTDGKKVVTNKQQALLLQQTVDSLTDRLKKTESKLKVAENNRDSYQFISEDLEKQLVSATDNLKKIEEVRISISNDLKEANLQISKLNKQQSLNTAPKANVDRQENYKKIYDKKSKEQQEGFDKLAKKLNEDLRIVTESEDNYKQQVKNLKKKISTLESEMKANDTSYYVSNEEYQQLKEELALANIQSKSGIPKSKYDDLKKQYDILLNEKNSMNAKYRELTLKITNEKTMDTTYNLLKQLEEKDEQIRELISQMEGFRENANAQSQGFGFQMSNLHQEYETFKIQSEASHQAQLQMLARKYKIEAEDLLDQRSEEVDQLQKELEDKLEELRLYKEFMDASNERSEEIENTLEYDQQKLALLENEVLRLEQAIQYQKDAHILELQQLRREFQLEKENIEKTVHNLQDERNSNMNNIKNFQTQFKNYLILIQSSKGGNFSITELEEYLSQGNDISNMLEQSIRDLLKDLSNMQHEINSLNIKRNADVAMHNINDTDIIRKQLTNPGSGDPNNDPSKVTYKNRKTNKKESSFWKTRELGESGIIQRNGTKLVLTRTDGGDDGDDGDNGSSNVEMDTEDDNFTFKSSNQQTSNQGSNTNNNTNQNPNINFKFGNPSSINTTRTPTLDPKKKNPVVFPKSIPAPTKSKTSTYKYTPKTNNYKRKSYDDDGDDDCYNYCYDDNDCEKYGDCCEEDACFEDYSTKTTYNKKPVVKKKKQQEPCCDECARGETCASKKKTTKNKESCCDECSRGETCASKATCCN